MNAGRESLWQFLREMSDAELHETAERLRGTSKRGRRRKLSEAEATALAAVWDEQKRRETARV